MFTFANMCSRLIIKNSIKEAQQKQEFVAIFELIYSKLCVNCVLRIFNSHQIIANFMYETYMIIFLILTVELDGNSKIFSNS